MQKDAKRCKKMQKDAKRCKKMQKDAKRCKKMQKDVKCSENGKKMSFPIRELNPGLSGESGIS
jgi:hypothetical protein